MRTSRLKIKWLEFKSVMKTEYGHIFKDSGVLLILVFALLIYATIYSLAYEPEVLRDIPIGVVDDNKTPASRQLAQTLDAAENIYVAYNPSSMEEAKELFYARKIYGVVNIPHDYEKKVLGGEQAIVGVYVDASYFLMYRQVFSDVVAGLVGTGAEVEFARLVAAGASIPQAQTTANPVSFKATNLYNPYLGYGSFVMPAVIILIIQQTLLIGIGMIGGTWREFGVYGQLRLPGEKRLSTIPIVLGKALTYMSIYVVTVTYVLTVHYKIFHFPMNGHMPDILLFMIPYLLSCIFFGIAVSTLFRRRENSILYLLWTSVPLLLLSGASIPKEAIPELMYNIGLIFPSSSGVNGFLRLQTMGASLSDVMPELTRLWTLTGIYFVLACLGIRRVMSRKDVAAVKSTEQ